MENNISASRQAKRFLDDRVRHDWDYPPAPPTWSASDEEVRDAQDFRERYYGESESEDSATEQDGASPYKFDNPDSIGDAVTQKREARKSRRRERLEREMEENEGLRIWVERRDVWTGATSVKKYGTKRRKQSSSQAEAEPTESPCADKATSQQDPYDLVPVAPCLLATNPIRASITPRAYPDIFQKIVVSARTPSVPINLGDMTKALVQGWKDNDEWPPKIGPLDPLAGKKRSLTGAAVSGGFMGRHPHLEKSMDSVKRMLHWNGHHQSVEPAEGGKNG